jgi:hypothetical protein
MNGFVTLENYYSVRIFILIYVIGLKKVNFGLFTFNNLPTSSERADALQFYILFQLESFLKSSFDSQYNYLGRFTSGLLMSAYVITE